MSRPGSGKIRKPESGSLARKASLNAANAVAAAAIEKANAAANNNNSPQNNNQSFTGVSVGDSANGSPKRVQTRRRGSFDGSNSSNGEEKKSEGGPPTHKRRGSVSGQSRRNSTSNPKDNKHTKELIMSRVFRQDAMPAAMKSKLLAQPELWADSLLAETNAPDVFEHYDQDQDGVIGRKDELPVLANDVVEMYVHKYKTQLKKEQPKLKAEQLEKIARKETPTGLNMGKSIEDAKKLMVEYLMKQLDLDKNGEITRSEFLVAWKTTSKNLLTIKISKGLACNIL